MSDNGKALQVKNTADFRALLQKALPSIKKVSEKHFSGERMIELACAARIKQPELQQCSPTSLLHAIVTAGSMGLGFNNREGALIPYKSKKTGEWECRFEPMYLGLCDIAYRVTGVTFRARVVYDCDEFEIAEGTENSIVHRPSIPRPDDAKAVLYYAVADFPTTLEVKGTVKVEKSRKPMWVYMEKSEVDSIRNRFDKQANGPWKTDYNEMAKKTVLKRLLKMIPQKGNELSTITDENVETINVIEINETKEVKSIDRGKELANKLLKRGN